MSAGRLRVLTIALFAAAAVFAGVAGNESGPYLAGAAGCFSLGVLTYFRWRRALRASVFAREDKTREGPAE